MSSPSSRLPAGSRSRWWSHTQRLALVAVALWIAGAAATGRAGIWGSLGGTAVLAALGALALDPTTRGLLVRPRSASLALGMVAGLAMATATILLYPLMSHAFVRIVRDTTDLYTAFGKLSPAVAVLLLGPIVLGEEVIWRGLVHNAIAHRFRRDHDQKSPSRTALSIAVAPTALLYALAMAPTGSPVLVSAALGGGLVWGWLRAHTGDLIAPFVAHVVWDAVVLFLRPLV